MLKSERDYEREIRNTLKSVQSAKSVEEFNTWKMSIQDCELLADCIKRGYLIGRVFDDDGELRTMDGKIHPELANTVITPKGLAFLNPKKTDSKATAAIIVSIVALAVSILSNLDKIVQNCRWLIDFLKSKG